ncbi:hypothetical protein [Sphingomicrobium flavum]|uniref:hypothetical protein n=1 Tax=Sphingomicrobium flavum TaxID=1229164 RepID=UPI0021ADFE66|nr:hypothetical protein [Sphingomicrobium flavum]
MHAQTAYRWRRRDEGFAARWGAAVVAFQDAMLGPGAVRGGALAALPAAEIGGEGRRVGKGRIGPEVQRAFLAELAATGCTQRAADAVGFSTAAFYRWRMKDVAFARDWKAAVALGRERLEELVLEKARASFDPDALPIVAGREVSVGEAINILKYGDRPGSGPSASLGTNEPCPAEVEAARSRILMRLERMRQLDLANGWSETDEGALIPPGYGKLP